MKGYLEIGRTSKGWWQREILYAYRCVYWYDDKTQSTCFKGTEIARSYSVAKLQRLKLTIEQSFEEVPARVRETK